MLRTGPKGCKVPDDEMFGQLFVELLVVLSCLIPQTRRRVCTQTCQTRLNGTDKAKCACGAFRRRHGVLTYNIESLRCVLRSIHGMVQRCVPTLALVVFTRDFDHSGATRFCCEGVLA